MLTGVQQIAFGVSFNNNIGDSQLRTSGHKWLSRYDDSHPWVSGPTSSVSNAEFVSPNFTSCRLYDNSHSRHYFHLQADDSW